MIKEISPKKIEGTIHVPASKSDSQRAILCAALAKGKSTLYNVGKSEDDKNMLRVVEELGAEVICVDNSRRIYEIDGSNAFKEAKEVNIGESGLGIRLLTAVLSSFKHQYTIHGKGSLVTRPMDFYTKYLPNAGVEVSSNNGLVPLSVKGPISTKEITVDGSLSSQFISGLLMAFSREGKGVVLHVQDLKSVPYVKMTLATLKQFGIEIESNIDTPVKMKPVPSIDDIYKHVMGISEVDINNQKPSTMTTFRMKGEQQYQPINYKIESDWSSASYWLVAKMLGSKLEIKGLDENSLQADKKLVDQFRIDFTPGVFSADERLAKGDLPFKFDATHCPDLFPALVTLAVFQKGVSTIKGVSRLKHKESDRGEVLKKEFEKLGATIELSVDEMTIHGIGGITGGKVSSNHDHRIAMCMGIAALYAQTPISIEGAEAVGKSYPEFWEDLEKVSN